MFNRLFIIFLISSITSLTAIGQNDHVNTRKLERHAKKAFRHEDFAKAAELYMELTAFDTANVEFNYNLGISFFNTGAMARSIPYFEFVRTHRNGAEYENTDYFLGKAYHSQHRFEKAIFEYETFLKDVVSKSGTETELAREIAKNLRNCEVGKTLAANPVNCIIKNLYDKINTAGQDQYPVISPDGKYLYFSGKNHEHEDVHADSKELHDPGDIFTAMNFNGRYSRPSVVSLNLHSEYMDAPTHITADGNLLFFLTVTPDKAQDIYVSEKINQSWIKPKRMGVPFNTEGNETGFSMNADQNIAVFSSDRSGGYGGQDLYISFKDEYGKWGPAINMGAGVNSPFNEEAPSISPDGRIIYFSCDGMNSIGGYDLFKTRFRDSVWAQPENLGFPINSAADDNHLTMYSDGIKGYFSSTRKGGQGGEDIYFLQIIDTTISPAKYLTFYQHNEVFEAALSKPAVGSHLHELVYFDFNASSIADFSENRLDKVVLLLNTYPEVKLEIQGYTDNKGTDEGNHLVSERRAKAVYRYLLTKGIKAERIKPVGHATENPVTSGDSEIEQAQNRRVEFEVLSPDVIIENSKHLGEYYIVKGSFSSKINAERLKEQLAGKALKATILEPDSNNKFYRVVLGEATSYEEAHRLLDNIPEDHKEGAWILSF